MEETDNISVNDNVDSESNSISKAGDFVEFKKPVYIGKIGKIPKKITEISSDIPKTSQKDSSASKEIPKESVQKPIGELTSPPYTEPKWSGLAPPGSEYKFEVLKSGVILETIDLTKQPFYVFGRNAVDITMAHPSVSRWHAVIQYKSSMKENDEHPIGWYIYDLGSSHGTFVNKNKIKPNHYVRVRVGHLIKLGCSSRQFILQGPEEDSEEESEFSLTELKEQRRKRKEMELEILGIKSKEETPKMNEDTGINWGMAEDAEDEVDLSENPFAATNNEDLYLDDPKKTLRGYFEREGVPLQYNCEEKGVGQFLCRVELPVEGSNGKPIIAEVIHKGKKKEAVIQCALEACRIIDRHGLLRQAKHESHKKKEKNWQEIDFYDSDEDTFLDRTGAVEKKREERIKKYKGDKNSQTNTSTGNKALTYEELVENCNSLEKNISELVKKLDILRNCGKKDQADEDDGDELDKFMKGLNKQSVADKAEISKTKMEIQTLKLELNKMQRLAEIAKPANIPALIKTSDLTETSKGPALKKTNTSVIIGKRLKVKNRIQTPYKQPCNAEQMADDDQCEEEVDSDEEDVKKIKLDCSGVERLQPDILQTDQETLKPQESLVPEEKSQHKPKSKVNKDADKRMFGPMRPPEGYVIPESYFDQESERDLPEEMDENQ